MRNENMLLNEFVPMHEKEWDARLFIDDAIKTKAEYKLESIARALTGSRLIEFDYANSEQFLENTEHIEGNNGVWIEKTTKYKLRARMKEYHFYGNNKIELWLKIIDFWAGKTSIFPCGGASLRDHNSN